MHANPDADALGSSLGLAGFLKSTGHEVSVVSPTEYPDFLKWMPENESVTVFNREKAPVVKDLFNSADMVFCLDFSGTNRVRDMGIGHVEHV